MQNEFHSYTLQMQRYLATQENRIAQLEKSLQLLREELTELRNKPPVHVGRIEYKFDQLKVETLEGTLNIGLNPNDLNQIDEFSINGTSPQVPYLFPEREAVIGQITQSIQGQMDDIITESERRAGRPIDSSYREFIKSDVARQLQQRIELYLDRTAPTERVNSQVDQVRDKVTEQIKNDILSAIGNFLTFSHKQTGGYNDNAV
ncbi:spore germination protein GerPC [Bacillus sp. V5-8f]|uniref:spore germination protein GerPC n=1 Tax=Bacillus sp. V5-8f TaxID=2053044 RepID=UPI00115A1721|nr:spore germination protein GerPC [Bacillus sp. V5-8f]